MLDAIHSVRVGQSTLTQAIAGYDEEIVPRGAEEVTCSVENGFMLHDWKKVQESPVFRSGFKPMTGHDQEKRVSEHAGVQMQRDREEKDTIGGSTS